MVLITLKNPIFPLCYDDGISTKLTKIGLGPFFYTDALMYEKMVVVYQFTGPKNLVRIFSGNLKSKYVNLKKKLTYVRT